MSSACSRGPALNQRCIVHCVWFIRSSLMHNGSLAHARQFSSSTCAGRRRYMEEFLMKILLATVALATLLSSSAHAQYGYWRGSYGAYAQVPSPYYRSYGSYGSYDLYGYRSPYPYSVYNDRGQYIGSDPDPR